MVVSTWTSDFPSTYEDPARELCGYADALEVLGPREVRARMAELGDLLVRRHRAPLAGA